MDNRTVKAIYATFYQKVYDSLVIDLTVSVIVRSRASPWHFWMTSFDRLIQTEMKEQDTWSIKF